MQQFACLIIRNQMTGVNSGADVEPHNSAQRTSILESPFTNRRPQKFVRTA